MWSGASVAHTPLVQEELSLIPHQTQDGIFGSSHLPSFRQETKKGFHSFVIL